MALIALLALGGCEPYVPELEFADCTSRQVDDDGVYVDTAYDSRGWPMQIEVRTGLDAEPVVTEIEVVRVAGRVVESLAVTGDFAVSTLYDSKENVEEVIPTDPDVEGYTCTHTYDGDKHLESDCTNGVVTQYDACNNPADRSTGEATESFGHSYDGCRLLNSMMLGLDGRGTYAENTQYLVGRPVSTVREREGALFSTFTTWDCPAAE